MQPEVVPAPPSSSTNVSAHGSAEPATSSSGPRTDWHCAAPAAECQSGMVALTGLDSKDACHGMAMSTFIPVSTRHWARSRSRRPRRPDSTAATARARCKYAYTQPCLAGASAGGTRGRALRWRRDHRLPQRGCLHRSGAVYIDECGTRFECSLADEIVASDHFIVTLRVDTWWTASGQQDVGLLIFHHSTSGREAAN